MKKKKILNNLIIKQPKVIVSEGQIKHKQPMLVIVEAGWRVCESSQYFSFMYILKCHDKK